MRKNRRKSISGKVRTAVRMRLGLILSFSLVCGCGTTDKTGIRNSEPLLAPVPTPTASPQPTASPSPSPPDNRKMAMVISNFGRMCKSKGYSNNEPCYGSLNVGDTVEVLKQDGPWFFVRRFDKTGWTHGDNLKLGVPPPRPPSPSRSDVPTQSDDVMRKIYEECARQQREYGDRSPLCDDVERNGIH